ncbi:unnamed protein product [Closterium sp. NIES-64]|nr:unnamed protein product [Closterium sp. NIES-64]CAI5994778.1 unnamed protein product [Closterium sp. NIES-64]
MSHPADVPVLPKGQRSRPAANNPISNNVDGQPALDQHSRSVSTDNEAQKNNISAVTDKLKGIDVSVPGGSGLSADKAAMTAYGDSDEDSDDEMLIDLDKEAESRLRSVVILLIPMMLEKEISSVSFIKESDALWVQKKDVVYQPLTNMGQLVTLHWLHAEDLSYAREKAMNPLAIEVMIRGVSAAVELDLLHDRLATYKLKSTQKPAFLRCTCLHRVLHPVTAASLKASSLVLPILRDPAIALVSTGGSREDWICTQAGCGKAKGKSFMSAADHITVAAHLQQLEKPGSATKASLDRLNLTAIRKDYNL